MASFSSRFAHNWVRLKYVGNDQPPSREFVGRQLLFDNGLVKAQELYSFIALPNRVEFDLCFLEETTLRRFLEHCTTGPNQHLWKDWQLDSAVSLDTMNIVVKFWTGRVTDHDVELYLRRFCDILEPPYKPVDQFGVWYGVRKYKIKVKNEDGTRHTIPNAVSLGPYSGRIFYPGQSIKCFTCGSEHHQVKDCKEVKCWKCGCLGHRAKECENLALCNLCGSRGHTFFSCPASYANKAKTQRRPSRVDSIVDSVGTAALPAQLVDIAVTTNPTYETTPVDNTFATPIETSSTQSPQNDTPAVEKVPTQMARSLFKSTGRTRGRRASVDVPGRLHQAQGSQRSSLDFLKDVMLAGLSHKYEALRSDLPRPADIPASEAPRHDLPACQPISEPQLWPELPVSPSKSSAVDDMEECYDSASDEPPTTLSGSDAEEEKENKDVPDALNGPSFRVQQPESVSQKRSVKPLNMSGEKKMRLT